MATQEIRFSNTAGDITGTPRSLCFFVKADGSQQPLVSIARNNTGVGLTARAYRHTQNGENGVFIEVRRSDSGPFPPATMGTVIVFIADAENISTDRAMSDG